MSQPRKAARAYARSWKRSCRIFVVGLIGGVAMVATTLWVAGGREASADSYRPLLALFVAPVYAFALFAGAWWFVTRRNRGLDSVFQQFGLKGEQAGGVMRGWHGSWNDRTFDAWVRKGPTLELYLGCRPATRGGVGRPGALGRRVAAAFADREPLDPPAVGAADLDVFADDPEWMRRFLAADGVGETLQGLLAETDRVSPMLAVAPDALHYTRRFLPLAEVTADNVRRWLTGLESLAAVVDTVGPSAAGDEPTRLETWGRVRRGRRVLPLLFGCLGLFTLVFMAGLVALFYFTHYR